MSCPDNNPCNQTPCTDPHDNCGCVNPNTFGCTSYSGLALPCIDIVNGEDGDSVLEKIEAAVCSLQTNKGKILINDDDTCPEFLFDKLEEGLNISFSISGTGCDRRLKINAVEGGVPVDVNAKVSSDDTTSGYLNDKIVTGSYISKITLNPAGNEQLQLDVDIDSLISTDVGNQITVGGDGGLSLLFTPADGSETKLIEGLGVIVSGTGTTIDPYIVSTNPSIQIVRSCFDSTWRNMTLSASGNANVVYASGNPQYRYRYDGTIEFRGSITYTVAFGAYSTSNRSFTVPMGSIPLTCITGGEQAGQADLKNINYIDVPQASADQITQQYGYVIRKNAQNYSLVFQSSFTNPTSKSMVVNFEGVVVHPLI